MHNELDVPNLNYNGNRYSPEEWAQVQATFSHRIWFIKVSHVASEAGRTHFRSRVRRWIYDHDLESLVFPLMWITLVIGIMVLMILVAVL